MRRSSPYLDAAKDPPDDDCPLCDGDGWVGHPYDTSREEPCECRNGDWPDPEDLRANEGCRRYHEAVDEGRL